MVQASYIAVTSGDYFMRRVRARLTMARPMDSVMRKEKVMELQ